MIETMLRIAQITEIQKMSQPAQAAQGETSISTEFQKIHTPIQRAV
jgi:hypothetical protein